MPVLIVDPQPLMRAGIRSALQQMPELQVVGTGSSSDDAIGMARTHAPEMVLMDVEIPGGGIAAARAIISLNRKVRVLFLTNSERSGDVNAALKAGACAYMLKGISEADLVRTIRSIIAGETFIMPQLATRLLVSAARGDRGDSKPAIDLRELNTREYQILMLVSSGQTNKEIARTLNLSEKTIKHYMGGVLQKLCARNRTEAAAILRSVSSSPGTAGSRLAL